MNKVLSLIYGPRRKGRITILFSGSVTWTFEIQGPRKENMDINKSFANSLLLA